MVHFVKFININKTCCISYAYLDYIVEGWRQQPRRVASTPTPICMYNSNATLREGLENIRSEPRPVAFELFAFVNSNIDVWYLVVPAGWCGLFEITVTPALCACSRRFKRSFWRLSAMKICLKLPMCLMQPTTLCSNVSGQWATSKSIFCAVRALRPTDE